MPGNHEALARALRAARSERGYTSDQALALAAGVHLQTLQNWMYGKTVPRSSQLLRVAQTLDKPMDYFSAIYEGREPAAVPLERVVADLTDAVRDLVTEIREERERGQDAATAMLRAAAALPLPKNGEGTTSTGRPVPGGTRG